MGRRRRLHRIVSAAAGLASAAVLPSPADAGLAVYRLGEQDFAAGQGPLWVDQAKAAGANEAYPFDGTTFGDDRRPGGYGKVKFRYAVTPGAMSADGVLTVGLLGLDSPPGANPTVRLFLDGVEQSNAPFAGVSSADVRSSASVVSVPVPAAMLADGILDVTIRSYRHGPGYPGNAIAADFSTLTLPNMTAGPGTGGPLPGGPLPGGNPGEEPGENPGEENPGEPGGHDPDGGGNGGTDPKPPIHGVPLPPAVFAGAIGLAAAAYVRRKLK